MILTEYGLHFAKDGEHWICVEWPDLLMLRGERYRVGEREFATLEEAQDELQRIEAWELTGGVTVNAATFTTGFATNVHVGVFSRL